MKEAKQSKEYETPQFQLVKQQESNKVFFTASGPTPPIVGGSLGSLSSSNGAW